MSSTAAVTDPADELRRLRRELQAAHDARARVLALIGDEGCQCEGETDPEAKAIDHEPGCWTAHVERLLTACPECDGRGFEDWNVMTRDGRASTREPCEGCGGTGRNAFHPDHSKAPPDEARILVSGADLLEVMAERTAAREARDSWKGRAEMLDAAGAKLADEHRALKAEHARVFEREKDIALAASRGVLSVFVEPTKGLGPAARGYRYEARTPTGDAFEASYLWASEERRKLVTVWPEADRVRLRAAFDAYAGLMIPTTFTKLEDAVDLIAPPNRPEIACPPSR